MTFRPAAVEVADDFAARASVEIASAIQAALRERGIAFVALAGGETPRPVYRKLAETLDLGAESLGRVHFFWSDERMVPAGDPRSNVAAATADLLVRLEAPGASVHAPNGADPPAIAARRYEREIRRVVSGKVPRFDLVLLGLGRDGHTASLFSGHESGQVSKGSESSLVLATAAPAPPRARITFSFELLAAAREVLFLVAGKDKAEVVSRVLERRDRSLPAARVIATEGIVRWILDAEAAFGLARPFSA